VQQRRGAAEAAATQHCTTASDSNSERATWRPVEEETPPQCSRGGSDEKVRAQDWMEGHVPSTVGSWCRGGLEAKSPDRVSLNTCVLAPSARRGWPDERRAG
jgi:hypothetical protein